MMATMALRPLVQNRAETQRGLGGSRQKEHRRVAGVSTRRFNEAATKKAHAITSKTHICPRACRANEHRIIVNKMKVLLVTSIKITLPDRDDRDRSGDVRRSHSPVELKPPGAGGLGDHGDDVFIFGLWGVVCVLALPGERRREERRSIRPLVKY
jgi:hypothetical protein